MSNKELEIARAKEIAEYKQVLKTFDISFESLGSNSPRNPLVKNAAVIAAQFINENTSRKERFYTKKILPKEELVTELGLNEKTIEDNKDYIVAITLLYTGNFAHLKEYMEI